MPSTKTGPQVLADFVHELVVEAQGHLEAAKQQFEDASTEAGKEAAAEMLEQATVDLAAAQSIKELADRNLLTDKRLQSKLKELRD